MKARKLRLVAAVTGTIALLPMAIAVIAIPSALQSGRIVPENIAAVAHQHVNATLEQHYAAIAEMRSEQHPQWKDLSPTARFNRAVRLGMRALSQSPVVTPSSAAFVGNQTFINPISNAVGLIRQSNCTLTLYNGTFSTYTSTTNASVQFTQSTADYGRVLHNAAGLSTSADVFARGCVDPSVGIGSRRAAYLGMTAQNEYFAAGTGFNAIEQANGLNFGTANPNSMTAQFADKADFSMPGLIAIAQGDLNGDGLADVVGLDSASGAIEVWLAKANGTFSAPTNYALAPSGSTTESVVVADVNGDGKLDVVVATRDYSSHLEQIWVLAGAGNGTLGAAQSMNVSTPMTAQNGPAYFSNMIAADIRGNGRNDIVASNGLVLLNNGSGTFTVAASAAFIPSSSSSNFGPNLAAADFNKDGKLDLAVDDGIVIHIYLGNGDGTFNVGNSYASDTEVGYLTATDLDGDGNVDLYVGIANGGLFGGDQFASQSYVLLGNGDGTFNGAPSEPFVYTGTNLADLNADGRVDAVGVNSDLSFTSYLGDGKGNFTAKGRLATSPFLPYGTDPNSYQRSYTLQGIDSYGLADINGDGHPDLLFLATGLVVRPPVGFDTPGIVIATGDGQGDFASPTFLGSGTFLADGNDYNPNLSNLRLIDVNQDGKADLVFNYTDQDFSTNYTQYAGVAVQLGNGDGTFQAPKTLVLYSGASSNVPTFNVIGSADLNKDGKPDLLIMVATPVPSAAATYNLELALGNGDGTFAAPTAVALNDIVKGSVIYGTQYASVVVADMNADGKPDIVSLGAATNGNIQIAIALGNGNGSFQPPSKTTYSTSYEDETLAVGDFNGDGKLDVAITGYFGSDDSGVTYGNGDGTLQPDTSNNQVNPNAVISLQAGGAAVAADFNGDGRPDVLSGSTLLLGTTTPAAVVPADFALSASSAAGSTSAGLSLQTTVTLTPSNGFSQSVSLACSGLPSGVACRFSPASVSLNASAATSTLTISTTARTAAASATGTTPWLPGSFALAGLLLPFALRSGATLRLGRAQWPLMLLMCMSVLGGCGGGSSSGTSSGGNGGSSNGSSSSSGGGSAGTPAGTYAITITGTAGSTTHAIQYMLTVS